MASAAAKRPLGARPSAIVPEAEEREEQPSLPSETPAEPSVPLPLLPRNPSPVLIGPKSLIFMPMTPLLTLMNGAPNFKIPHITSPSPMINQLPSLKALPKLSPVSQNSLPPAP